MPFSDQMRRCFGGLDAFDYFVLAGVTVNLVVILSLVGYWLVAN